MKKIKLLFLKIKYFFSCIKLRRFWKKVRKLDYINLVTPDQFREKNPRSIFNLKHRVLSEFGNELNLNADYICTLWSEDNE